MSSPRNRRKRQLSPPSEDNNSSFMKSLSEKVSSFFPTGLTKWFSSPKSAKSNGSVPPVADGTDYSSDDDDDDTPTTIQPPMKRPRINSPGEYSQLNPVDVSSVATTSLETKETSSSVVYSTAQLPPNRSIFRHETNFMPTQKKPRHEESFIKNNEEVSSMFKMQHRISPVAQSIAKRRKTIFDISEDKTKATPNQAHNSKESYFRPNLLCSSFYPGSTVYGGALASSINQVNVKQRQVKVMNKSQADESVLLSQATRRIMDLLENYSSPLSEARRMSPYVKNPNITKSLLTPVSPPQSEANRNDYKFRELNIPNIATIIQLKHKSRLMESTKAARQLIASHSSTVGLDPLVMTKYDGRKDDETILQQTANLGDNIAPSVSTAKAVLERNLDNLPNFTSKSTQSNAPSVATFTLTNSTQESKIKQLGEPQFKFSKPITVVSDIQNISKTFFYNSGDSNDDGKDKVILTANPNEQKQVSVAPVINKDMLLVNMLKEWKCLDCWVSNNQDADKCVCCGGKRPSVHTDKPKKCSICNNFDAQKHFDKCINCEKNQTMKIASPIKFKEAVIWKCIECWVTNDNSADSCVCCGGTKPKEISSNMQIVTTNSNNKITTSNSATIESTNDAKKQLGLFQSVKQTDDVFAKIVDSQKNDMWDCHSCLVKNPNNKTLCICCGSERNFLKNDEISKVKFNFNTNIGAQFKFGIFNSGSQNSEIDPMEDESLPEVPKIIETEIPNNNLFKMLEASNINFGNKVFSKEITGISKVDNFGFGLPKYTMTIDSASAQLMPPLRNPSIEKEKAREIPKIDFEPIKQNTMQDLLYSSKSENNECMPLPFTVSPFSSNDKKISKEFTTASQVSMPHNTFRFTASKLDVSGNMFDKNVPTPAVTIISFTPASQRSVTSNVFDKIPSTSTITNVSFAMPLQNVSTSNSPSLLPIFQTSETNTTNPLSSLFSEKDNVHTKSLSLFQTSEPVVTTAQMATLTNIFSFGSNTQQNNPIAPTAKPFNFMFNKSDTIESSTIFKPSTFTIASESNNGSNNFTVTSESKLGGGNGPFGISGNGLKDGNSITGSTSPTTNSLVGNTDISSNVITPGNGLQTNSTLPGFGASSSQKENMWSPNNPTPNNMFVTNTTVETSQPPLFAFGSQPSFNANNSTPSFGNNTQATPIVFGMSNQSGGTQPNMFSNPASNQTTSNLFGNSTPQMSGNPTLPISNMFGSSNVGATSTFGVPNPSIPTFDTSSSTLAKTPTFNFSATPPTNAVVSFGQQQQQQQQTQPTQPGLYNFGGNNNVAPSMQFNIGTAGNTGVRRMRKAVRRNPQR